MKACSGAEKPLLQGLPLQATVLPPTSQLPLKFVNGILQFTSNKTSQGVRHVAVFTDARERDDGCLVQFYGMPLFGIRADPMRSRHMMASPLAFPTSPSMSDRLPSFKKPDQEFST